MAVKIDYEKCCWKCTSCSCKGACVGCVKSCPVDAIVRIMINVFLVVLVICKHGALDQSI